MNEINVVIINGAPQAGKDTFVNYCTRYCNTMEYARVINISSVDIHKQVLKGLGWNGIDKSQDVRDMLCQMKEFSINVGNDMPTRYMVNKILKLMYEQDDYIVFCHVREKEEIDKLVKSLDGLHHIGIKYRTLYIDRHMEDQMCTNDADISAAYCDKNDYMDLIINNGTLDELQTSAESYVNKLIILRGKTK